MKRFQKVIRAVAAATAGAAIFVTGASAGEFQRNEEGVETYSLTSCQKPPQFQIAPLSELKGAARVEAFNVQAQLYNRHVERVNDYLSCIFDEADGDLRDIYSKVISTLNVEQARVIGDLNGQQKVLYEQR